MAQFSMLTGAARAGFSASRRTLRVLAFMASLTMGWGCSGGEDALPEGPPHGGEAGADAGVHAGTRAPVPTWEEPFAALDGGARALTGYRVLGEFIGEFDPSSGRATVDMVQPGERKSASEAVPGMAQGLRSNEESDPIDGRVRFLQDASGNGQTVGACENFWTDRWVGGNEDWHFWLPGPPSSSRQDFLVDLAGDMLENRFCTNFELINDVGRPLREVWIIVDGITIPGARAWVQALPRVSPGQGGDPDVTLEPSSLQGMFRYGDFAENDSVMGQWYFYLGAADLGDFRVRGRIVEIFRERCWTGEDDNGDGLVDSGCRLFSPEAACSMNQDCLSDNCDGGVPIDPMVSGSGQLGECIASGFGDPCFANTDCAGALVCSGGDFGSQVFGSCTTAEVPAVQTDAPDAILAEQVTFVGTLLGEGSNAVVSHGFCWGPDENPSLGDPAPTQCNSTTGSPGVGLPFEHEVSGLSPATTVHVRAYAQNADGTGYGAGRIVETPPLAPTGVTASEGSSVEHVDVSWTASSGATGYRVYRDGTLVETLGAVTSMQDTGAGSPQALPAPTDVSATDGLFEVVDLTWTAPTPGPGTTHDYTVTALYGDSESVASDAAEGFRGALVVSGYEVSVDGGGWVATGSAATLWTDSTALPGTIEPGTPSASEGTSADLVAIVLADAGTASGPSRTYEVRAVSGTVTGAGSASVSGNRAVGPLQVQWQRSSGDADSDYTNLDGAVGQTFNDTTAPADGSGRWYKALLSAQGASETESPGVRGFRLAGPTGLTASQGTSSDHVSLSWTGSAGATGYRVYRDASFIAAVGSVFSFDDTGAAAGGAPTAVTDLMATTDQTANVQLSWSQAASPNGTTHSYTVTALNGASESGPSASANGYRGPRPITGYEVQVAGGVWQTTGASLPGWTDTTAPAGTITPGTAAASDGTSPDHVSLVLSGASTTPGTARTYRVRAVNASGTAAQSNQANGNRSIGALSIQWERSAGDSNGSYAGLAGATSTTYNDATAPASGAGRWYRARLTADGAAQQFSTADRGFRLATPIGLAASQGTSPAHVTLSWNAVSGATGYRIYRDGVAIQTVGEVTSLDDASAGAGGAPPAPTSVTASKDRVFNVELTWTAPTPPPGTTHSYRVSALNGAAESAQSGEATGFRGPQPVTDYEVSFNGGATYAPIGSTDTTWIDTGATAGSIIGGTATASDGTSTSHVALNLSGQGTNNGASRSYRVRAENAAGIGAASVEGPDSTGYRVVGPLSFAWQRSSGDAPSGYAALAGATTTSHNDTTAPINGDGRYYRVRISGAGATNAFSTAARGYREPSCPELAVPGNGTLAFTDANRIGSVVSYSCNTGHVIDDVAAARYLYDADEDTMLVERECQADNTWSGVPVECTAACSGGGCPLGWCPDDTVWRRCAPSFQAGTVTFRMVYVPRGSYSMGSPLSPAEPGRAANEGPVEVTLTRPFYMMNTEVTQAQWEVVTGQNPACFQAPGMTNCNTFNANSGAPVERISWWSALGYANALSNALGLEACYEMPGTGCTGTWQAGNLNCGDANMPGVNAPGGDIYACEGLRLPTEAEWEFAARAGTLAATYNGGLPGSSCSLAFPVLDPIAHLSCNANMPQLVGQKNSNAWGLFDMLGNVWHWTWDRYVVNHPGGTDPAMETTGDMRTRRGASYLDDPQRTRAAYRFPNAPSVNNANYGFRLVRTVQ